LHLPRAPLGKIRFAGIIPKRGALGKAAGAGLGGESLVIINDSNLDAKKPGEVQK
jgi:hypothetical protein